MGHGRTYTKNRILKYDPWRCLGDAVAVEEMIQ